MSELEETEDDDLPDLSEKKEICCPDVGADYQTGRMEEFYDDPRTDDDMDEIYHQPRQASPVVDRFDPVMGRIDLEESFAQAVIRLVKEKGLTDPQCYNRANLSRAVFNKIKQSAYNTDPSSYRPSKQTALALAVGLRLSLEETRSLLEKAGLTLSHSSKGDIIVEYFLLHENYDLFLLNEMLYRFDQPLLGSF